MSIPFSSLALTGVLLACLRLILGGTFLFGGMVKLTDRRAFDGALRALVRNEQQRIFLSRGLPLLEAVLGALLLFNVATVLVTCCVLLLLVVFSTILLYGWRTHQLKECGCARAPLPPQAALMRNGLFLLLGGIVLWRPDPSFSPWLLLMEGIVVLFLVLLALRGTRQSGQPHPRLSAQSGPSRRSLLRRGLALSTALALPFLNPVASLACECDCIIDEYYSWGSCICGIQAFYDTIIWCCCDTDIPCDVTSEAIGFVEC